MRDFGKKILWKRDHLRKEQKTSEELQFSLNDLYGYEGELCGVLIGDYSHSVTLNYNSEYRFAFHTGGGHLTLPEFIRRKIPVK